MPRRRKRPKYRPFNQETAPARHGLVCLAIAKLHDARNALRRADAPQAYRKVLRALKSAEGAERHAYNRVHNQLEHPDQYPRELTRP